MGEKPERMDNQWHNSRRVLLNAGNVELRAEWSSAA